jgi:hypothetical protein
MFESDPTVNGAAEDLLRIAHIVAAFVFAPSRVVAYAWLVMHRATLRDPRAICMIIWLIQLEEDDGGDAARLASLRWYRDVLILAGILGDAEAAWMLMTEHSS